MKTEKNDLEQATDEQSQAVTDDQSQNDDGGLRGIFTIERSTEFVDRVFNEDRDNPATFMRLLLLLHDHSDEPPVKDALMHLMMGAYNVSMAHSDALDKYLDTLRAESRQQSAAW
ncbi:MAG: hypothetical protein WBV94_11615 [Blastocatellia bacterium]